MVRAVRNPLFFFRQKTAYEMRISVWSSDVCSSDLILASTALPSATPAAETSALRPRAVAAYAATAGPTVMLGLPFSVYLPPYIAEGGTISVALIGLLFSLTTIWDGVVDPLIGTMVDRVRTEIGRASGRERVGQEG